MTQSGSADALTEGAGDSRRKLHHTPKTSLSAGTAQSSGMRRLAGISGDLAGSERLWMGEAHVAPGSRSADHHHGESETGIYVVSGHPAFVFRDNGVEVRIEAGPGDYVYVPPFVAHREENPSPNEDAVVILARTTQEAIVVNIDRL
jgi:uncharacterized RmlC-like cupin family protein